MPDQSIDFPGAAETFAGGINDSEEIVGEEDDTGGGVQGCTLISGVFARLDFPGATGTIPNSVNNLGQIAGFYETKAHPQVAYIAQRESSACNTGGFVISSHRIVIAVLVRRTQAT